MLKKFYKILSVFFLLLIFVTISGCGEGTIDIGDNTYAPQIVIEGYLYPGKKVSDIKISRNLPITTTYIDSSSLFIADADVSIFDFTLNKSYKLGYNNFKHSYQYTGDSLNINYGQKYKITVNARIDGRDLQASASTLVPNYGFSILEDKSVLGELKYREKDGSGNMKNFTVTVKPSPGTDFYAISSNAVDADLKTFIYDNPVHKFEIKDVSENFYNFKYQTRRLMDINSYGESVTYVIDWFDVWFYSRYRIIVYACDDNFKYYILTHSSVKEVDGNFHEPRMFIEGDGIGIFGSAIADTVYFKVTQ